VIDVLRTGLPATAGLDDAGNAGIALPVELATPSASGLAEDIDCRASGGGDTVPSLFRFNRARRSCSCFLRSKPKIPLSVLELACGCRGALPVFVLSSARLLGTVSGNSNDSAIARRRSSSSLASGEAVVSEPPVRSMGAFSILCVDISAAVRTELLAKEMCTFIDIQERLTQEMARKAVFVIPASSSVLHCLLQTGTNRASVFRGYSDFCCHMLSASYPTTQCCAGSAFRLVTFDMTPSPAGTFGNWKRKEVTWFRERVPSFGVLPAS
jgi:hypothetical protein